jgi:hypothetical protein
MHDKRENREYQKKMDHAAGNMKSQPTRHPNAKQYEEQNQEQKVTKHIVSGHLVAS